MKQITNMERQPQSQKIIEKSYSVGGDFILLPSADPVKRQELETALFNMKHHRNSDKDYKGNNYESMLTNNK